MAGKFVVNGDQTTVSFTWTALTTKVLATVNDDIAYLYHNHSFIPAPIIKRSLIAPT